MAVSSLRFYLFLANIAHMDALLDEILMAIRQVNTYILIVGSLGIFLIYSYTTRILAESQSRISLLKNIL